MPRVTVRTLAGEMRGEADNVRKSIQQRIGRSTSVDIVDGRVTIWADVDGYRPPWIVAWGTVTPDVEAAKDV